MKNILLTALFIGFISFIRFGAGSVLKAETLESAPSAPDWVRDAVLYEVNLRQYTEEGSFEAFSEHLEELWDMGINTLWFMPIHPISETNRLGSLGSYYSVSDYRDVNPEFGTLADFGAMMDQAKGMGFHVILDWVANHTGWDNAWITEHPDWYTQKEGKIISPEGTGWNDVADLNYEVEAMRQEMIDCMRFWVSEYDIDGFRCDYAIGVPVDFWAEARQELEKIKPVFFLEEDLPGQNRKLLEEAFDCNYSCKYYETLIQVAHNNKTADKLKMYRLSLPEGDFPMYYLDNHDVNSYDRTIVEAFPQESLPAMWTHIFTMPGMPMLYTGDQISYNHKMAFMEKDSVDWGEVSWDASPLIRELSRIRRENPALYTGREGGSFEELPLGNKKLLAYQRASEDRQILCVFNLSADIIEDVDLSSCLTGTETVLLSGAEGAFQTGGDLPEQNHTFLPWAFMILAR